MNKETFGYKLLKTIFSTYSAAITILGIALTFICWKIKADFKISIWILVLISSFALLFIIILLKFSITLFLEKQKNSANIFACMKPYPPFQNNELILLTENIDAFATDGLVSIYQEKNDFEILIGIGIILLIQENSKVQVLIPKQDISNFDWTELKNNEKDLLKSIIIKPIIPKQIMGGINE